MIPSEFIQSLLTRIDIVDVIEQRIPLKRAGANYAACCPFHSEKTPSFTVSPAKQFYHCFGCGAHGTAISFLIEHDGLSFVEAVTELAGQVGLIIPISQSHRTEIRSFSAKGNADAIHEALRGALHYFRNQLKKSEKAIAYLKRREVSGEIAAKFGLGYAPDCWQGLASQFSDYQSSVLLQAGLVIENSEGRRYDRFRDRIMFPILSVKGNVIGFGGRVLGEGEPKYLNSPETPVFEKGREVYGLVQARGAIRNGGGVIVVEGYMDVVALAQRGVENAVAMLGTATTSMHIQSLFRQADRVYFCFDGDRAGRAAAWRALENCLPELLDTKQVSFVFLPEEHDPDSFIRQFSREEFGEKLRTAIPLSEFFIRELKVGVNFRSQEGRAQFIEMAKPLVKKIKASIFSLQIRKRLAQEAGLTQVELDQEYGFQRLVQPRNVLSTKRVDRQAPSLARHLLKCLIALPDLARDANIRVPDEPSVESDMLLEVINYVVSASGPVTTGALMQGFVGAPQQRVLVNLYEEALTEWRDDFEVKKWFDDVMRKIHAAEASREFDALSAKSKQGPLTSEELARFQELIATRT
jgi:DNA primase